MSLNDWLKNGWLIEHQTTQREIDDDKLIIQFDMFRKKRNISDYLRAGEVSDLEVKEMIALAKRLRNRAEEWIKAKSVSHD